MVAILATNFWNMKMSKYKDTVDLMFNSAYGMFKLLVATVVILFFALVACILYMIMT